MSKYDALKFLKETKAKIPHICDECGKEIKKGEIYYPESIGRVNAPASNLKNFAVNAPRNIGNRWDR